MGLFRASLPAFAFFVLLGGTASVGYWFGAARAAHDTRIFTCSMHPQVQHEGPGLCPICHMELVPRDTIGSSSGGAITIDPVVVQNMGVRTQPVHEGELARELRWFGTLAVAQPRVRDVTIKFAAVVERLFADRDGMPIAAGAPLLELYAPDLIVAEERLIAAKRSGDPASMAAARLRLSRWDLAEAQIEALLQSEKVERTIVWPSPASGIVLQRNVVQGSSVEAGQSPVRIADLSMLWLEAQAPARDLALIAPGATAHVRLDGSNEDLTATVLEVLPTLDSTLRTGTVRCQVPNPTGTLRPGQFAQVSMRLVLASKALLIPDEAVLDSGVRHVAYVALGNGRFEARTLQLGQSAERGMVEVLQGVKSGELVVTSGQFLIDAESRLHEGANKLSDANLLGGGALPAPAALHLDAAQQASVDSVFAKYLAVQTKLAADQEPLALWTELATAASALPTTLPEPARGLRAALQASLATTPSGVKPARTAFEAVSKAAIPLFAAARPSPAFGSEVYVMFCSMVPASWLQQGKTLRNPYHGSEMLECGELKQTLTTAPEAKR